MFGIAEILIHTWDLARVTGLHETLDPDEVQDLFVGMEPMGAVLRQADTTARGSSCLPTPTSK